jgi:hypothetical protein
VIKQAMMAAALTMAVAPIAAPANAQLTSQEGLVNVTIGDISILDNFLNDSQVAALNNLSVPVSVQVPVSVAATVCGVTVAVLAAAGSAAKCTAKSGSQALADAVVTQVLPQIK